MSEALDLQVGDTVIFKKYVDLPPGTDPLFKKGQELTIEEIETDGGYLVIDEDGNKESIFPDEFTVPEGHEDGEADEEEETEDEDEDEEEADEEEEDTEEEEAEEDTAEFVKADFKDLQQGDIVLVVDADDNDVVEGEVTKKTSASITIDGNTYKKKDFNFFVAPAEGEYEEEETEDEDEEEAEEPEPEKPARGKKSGKARAQEEPKAKAKAPAKKSKNAAAEKQEEESTDSEGVRKLLAEKDALDAAKEIAITLEENYYNLGGVLSHIYEEELYTQLGYDGDKAFDRYVSEELGVEYRKSMYLIKIYNHFSALGVDESKLIQIGWSKAKELVAVATLENFDELIEYAESNSRDALKKFIEVEYLDAGEGTPGTRGEPGPKSKLTKFNFATHEDFGNVVLASLTKAKSMYEAPDENQAFIAIMTEWAQLVDGVDVPTEEAIRVLEKRQGIKITGWEQAGKAKAKAPAKEKAAPKAPAKKAPAKKAPAKKAPAKRAPAKGKGRTR